MITLVAQETENGVDVFFGRLVGRSTNGTRQQGHAVLLGFVFLDRVQPRKKSQLQDVFDALGLEKFVVGIGFWFRSFVNAFVQLLEANEMCAGRRMNATDVRRIVADGRLPDGSTTNRNQNQEEPAKMSHQMFAASSQAGQA